MSTRSHDHGPILKRKLGAEVLDRLKARITSGEFAPGAHLPSERALMDTYGVGRPAIREALQQLERLGMVAISHGERARVVVPTAAGLAEQLGDGVRYLLQVDPNAMAHLKDARVLIETGIVRLAAERADAAGIALLRQCFEDHRTANLDDFLARDIAFHRQIARMSGNPLFPALIEAMLAWLATHHTALVRAPGAENLTLSEHAEIVEAIAARDGARAVRAMADHLNRANALYAVAPDQAIRRAAP